MDNLVFLLLTIYGIAVYVVFSEDDDIGDL